MRHLEDGMRGDGMRGDGMHGDGMHGDGMRGDGMRGDGARNPGPAAVQRVPAVEVRRSTRRRRTVSAYQDGDRVIVLIPARFTAAEERDWVAKMLSRLSSRGRRSAPASDEELLRRARNLSSRYLAGRARPVSVRWVPQMRTRWASCTPSTATIRLSVRLASLPSWVSDYVLLHELAHLLEPGHGETFWALLQGYPRTERARGYLDGVSAAVGLSFDDDLSGDVDDHVADLADLRADNAADHATTRQVAPGGAGSSG